MVVPPPTIRPLSVYTLPSMPADPAINRSSPLTRKPGLARVSVAEVAAPMMRFWLTIVPERKVVSEKKVELAFTWRLSLWIDPSTVLLPVENALPTERSSATPRDAKDPAPWNTLEPW